MGIFSFIKDAGKKIFGVDKERATDAGRSDKLIKDEKKKMKRPPKSWRKQSKIST